MPQVTDTYLGELCVNCVHNATQASVRAESRIGELGHAESFSPLDLLDAAFGSCALITMGYFASQHNLDITGAEADVDIAMSADGWSIAKISITFRMPARSFKDEDKKALEKSFDSCPVHKALAAVEQEIKFIWL